MSELTAIILSPPCTNADLHLGHLSGVYTLGDIYGKYRTLLGEKVITITGADQNNSYTLKKADELKIGYDETQILFAEKFKATMSQANINYDHFVETRMNDHMDTSQEIIHRLMNAGLVVEKQILQFYCNHCREWLCDNQVSGECAVCGQMADGAICENCCAPVFNSKLIRPAHVTCLQGAQLRPLTVLVFQLVVLRQQLLMAIKTSQWDERLKQKYIEYLSRDETPEMVMTNTFKEGIAVKEMNSPGNKVAIWFEAVWVYFTAMKQHLNCPLDELIGFLNTHDVDVIPFMGQDTEFYFSLAFAAVHIGLGINRIPDKMAIQRFIKLEGKKFSSSRNHVLFLDNLLQEVSLDAIRLYSLSLIKPYADNNNNFDMKKLKLVNENLNKVLKKLNKLNDSFQKMQYQSNVNKFEHDILNQYCQTMNNFQFFEVFQWVTDRLQDFIDKPEDKILIEDIAVLKYMLVPILSETSEDLLFNNSKQKEKDKYDLDKISNYRCIEHAIKNKRKPKVLITGCNRGLGLALAKVFNNSGWHVIACVRDVKTVSDEILSLANQIFACDMNISADICQFQQLLKNTPIDVLINNAGVYAEDNLAKISPDLLHQLYQVNAVAPLLLVKSLLNNLKLGEKKVIINIGGRMGSFGSFSGNGIYAYRLSKAGVHMSTKILAEDLASMGIKVISIHPGWIKTEMGGADAKIETVDSASNIYQIVNKINYFESGYFYTHEGIKLNW